MNCPQCRTHMNYEAGLSYPPKLKTYFCEGNRIGKLKVPVHSPTLWMMKEITLKSVPRGVSLIAQMWMKAPSSPGSKV